MVKNIIFLLKYNHTVSKKKKTIIISIDYLYSLSVFYKIIEIFKLGLYW